MVTESDYPCLPMVVGNGQKPMFRVLYFKNRISIEIFHALTDGGGGFSFFKNIVARYLQLLGCQFENTDGVVDYTEEPKDYETEDSFGKLYQKGLRINRNELPAYQYKPAFKDDYVKTIQGLIYVDELKQLTKAKGVTITEYLTAVYLYAFYIDMLPNRSKKQIKISTTIDLRRLFGFQTFKNCSLYANIGIEPDKKEYTFEDILAETVIQLKAGVEKDTLRKIASTNSADANLLIFRILPIFIKKMVLKIGYMIYGPRLMTSCFSNLGVVSVPKGIEEQIDHFEVTLGSREKSRLNCGAISYGNILNINLSSISEETAIQRFFFTFLSEQGISIKINSNIQTEIIMGGK